VTRLHSILDEALENDYILKNTARKVIVPPCKSTPGVRSMSETEVLKLWDGTEAEDYIVWRILLLTGARIGEVFALRRDDVGPAGLRIDESAVNGGVKCPKNRRTRTAPLADSLRAEVDEWLGTHSNDLFFPNRDGGIYRRTSSHVESILDRGKALIPDLTFRMCRTTFGSLFEGDEGDRTSIMGHHSPDFTLKVYRKGVSDRSKSSVEDLDRRIRSKKVIEIKRAG
jgi:integrase